MAEQERSDSVFEYPRGEALEVAEALEVTRTRPTRVVVLAGPQDSGKTTLIAGLYELFHFGRLGGYLFAGSKTLIGFEQQCHLARRASGRETADTERTRLSLTHRQLHLRVRRPEMSDSCDLLMADISGEVFEHAADSAEDCRRLGILRRADHVAVLMDGEKLASNVSRQEVVASADAFLRTCVETGMLAQARRSNCSSRNGDLVGYGDGAASRISFVEQKRDWLVQRYAQRLGRLDYHATAARPTNAQAEVGFGLLALLDAWVTRPRNSWWQPASRDAPAEFSTEFDRYLRAWPPGGSTKNG